jgi:hypothetical protein
MDGQDYVESTRAIFIGTVTPVEGCECGGPKMSIDLVLVNSNAIEETAIRHLFQWSGNLPPLLISQSELHNRCGAIVEVWN